MPLKPLKEQIILRWKVLDSKKNRLSNKLYLKLLLGRYTKLGLTKDLYPHYFDNKSKKNRDLRKKRKIKNLYRTKIHPLLNYYVKIFDANNWLLKYKSKKYTGGRKPIVYKATLDPYFEYLSSKNNNSLSIKQKNIVKYIFMQDIKKYLKCPQSSMLTKYIDSIEDVSFLSFIDNYLKKLIYDYILDLISNKVFNDSINESDLEKLGELAEISITIYDETFLEVLNDAINYKIYFHYDSKNKITKTEYLNIKKIVDCFHYYFVRKTLKNNESIIGVQVPPVLQKLSSRVKM